jgi:hypothetical protein
LCHINKSFQMSFVLSLACRPLYRFTIISSVYVCVCACVCVCVCVSVVTSNKLVDIYETCYERHYITRLGIFLFTAASRTALGSTQPPIQWVPGDLSLGVKRPGRGADHSPTSSAEVKEWVELYLHSPNTPSWRGA